MRELAQSTTNESILCKGCNFSSSEFVGLNLN